MSRHGIPIEEYPIRRTLDSGIEMYSEFGLVPEFEEREACVFSNYTWKEWLSNEWQERAQAVAHYRLHHIIDSHVQQAAEQYAKRQSR